MIYIFYKKREAFPPALPFLCEFSPESLPLMAIFQHAHHNFSSLNPLHNSKPLQCFLVFITVALHSQFWNLHLLVSREKDPIGWKYMYGGWDGWIASPTQWTWFWANSGKQWRTEKLGVLESVASQTVRHDYRERERERLLIWNWLMWLFRLRSPMICSGKLETQVRQC